ncbi:MAG: hypothetical protein QW728_06580, partial [Thermoplasmata archaeon]
LWVVMETKDMTLGTDYEFDLAVRSFDGVSWGSWTNIIGSDGLSADELPAWSVWYNPVKKEEELVVMWVKDYDINSDG